MTQSQPDPDEVARQVAAKNDAAEAREQEKARRAEAARNAPVAPSPTSRWRFGIERHETSDGDTLVIRCYRRKLGFSEHDHPFALEPRGYVIAGLGLAIAVALAWLVDDLRFGLAVFLALIIGLVYAHYARIVRIHITRLNDFVIYERDPKRAIGMGPISDLSMDEHSSGGLSMRCQWIVARGPKWVSKAWFGLDGLRRADWLTVQQFIAKHRLRGL